MISFKIKSVAIQRIPPLALKPYQTRIVIGNSIKYVKDRVQLRHTDIYDIPMPAYSPKPVYVQLARGGHSKQLVLKSGKTTITSLAALKRTGVKVIDMRAAGRTELSGKLRRAVVRTGNSIRFPNRAAYKRFLGKTGLRDLTETGAMLAALGVVSQSGIYAKVITIGFRNTLQERKARGNAAITNWVGLSPVDQVKLVRLLNGMFAENLGLPHSFVTTKGFSSLTAQ